MRCFYEQLRYDLLKSSGLNGILFFPERRASVSVSFSALCSLFLYEKIMPRFMPTFVLCSLILSSSLAFKARSSSNLNLASRNSLWNSSFSERIQFESWFIHVNCHPYNSSPHTLMQIENFVPLIRKISIFAHHRYKHFWVWRENLLA